MRFDLSQTRIESQVHLVDFGRRFSHNVLLLQNVLKNNMKEKRIKKEDEKRKDK